MSHVASFATAIIIFLFSSANLVCGLQYANCECGISSNVQNRIVGGWDASPHEFPWLVAINNKGKLYCGGAIINDRYILTAGHCVRWSKRSELTVIIRQHDRRMHDGVVLPISKMILHRDFYSHRLYDENDIALIKLKTPLQFTPEISPVCLPKSGSKYDHEFGTVAGWGKLGSNKKISTVLQQTLVKILTNEECSNTTMRQYLNDHVMCAYFDNTDACQGDSGGPLTFEQEAGKTEQIGIVSWGIGCASPNTPGIYTKVTYYLDWISKNTQDAYYCKNN